MYIYYIGGMAYKILVRRVYVHTIEDSKNLLYKLNIILYYMIVLNCVTTSKDLYCVCIIFHTDLYISIYLLYDGKVQISVIL